MHREQSQDHARRSGEIEARRWGYGIGRVWHEIDEDLGAEWWILGITLYRGPIYTIPS